MTDGLPSLTHQFEQDQSDSDSIWMNLEEYKNAGNQSDLSCMSLDGTGTSIKLKLKTTHFQLCRFILTKLNEMNKKVKQMQT